MVFLKAGEEAGHFFGGLVLGDGDSARRFLRKVRTKGFILPLLTLIDTQSGSTGSWQGGRAPLYLGDAPFGPAMGRGVLEESRAGAARPGPSCCPSAERGAAAKGRVLVWDRLGSARFGHAF